MKWIKHDTDANLDAKLQNVMLDYGLEGYGLYWYCIELIAGNVNKENLTFELEHDARIIARNTGSTSQKVEEMMRYFVEIGLFENSRGTISCLKLAKRLDKSMTSNPEMRAIIEQLKNHDCVMVNHDESMTESENPMQDQIRLDQTRLDQNKNSVSQKRNKSTRKKFVKPTQDDVLNYFIERGVDPMLANQKTDEFFAYYDSVGWKIGGKSTMKDWKGAVRTWVAKLNGSKAPPKRQGETLQQYKARTDQLKTGARKYLSDD